MIHIYTDGGCKSNPGPSAIAGYANDTITQASIFSFYESCGHGTNNQAEYKALIKALTLAIEHRATEVVCHSDSQLMVHQMNGRYKVHDRNLRPLQQQAKDLAKKILHCTFVWIPREDNTQADALVWKAYEGM